MNPFQNRIRTNYKDLPEKINTDEKETALFKKVSII